MTKENTMIYFVREVQQAWNTGHATEHGYRPALQRLMSAFNNVIAVNDPKRSAHGNPDFIFLQQSQQNIILGYAEAKDINIYLDKTETTEQMHRYTGYDNLFLTNCLEFRFFKNGVKYQTIEIGKIVNNQLEFNPPAFSLLEYELRAFLEQAPERIKSGKRLAQIMGAKARRIRNNVTIYLNHQDDEKNQELEKIYKMMRTLLVHDLTPEKFADMYAQTLVYGLFVARYGDESPSDFNRQEARDLVPASNPFLREFFDHIVGPRFDARLGYIVDELCEVFSVSDVQDIVHKHLKVTGKIQDDKDPIIHFYEDFLKEYDPIERKKMGAYYTPIPVVKFIIRQVDEILKRDFGLVKGLADTSKKPAFITSQSAKVKVDLHKVQILDPAVGTATFLNEIIKYIHQGFEGQEGRWPSYVESNLLPRLYGFELMMAPYTIAHLKLSMTLRESGVKDLNHRLGVYLTNTLEEGIKDQMNLFTHFGLAEIVSNEADQAAKIKYERPIMVIVGNPPYSGISSNNTSYANNLVNKYKVEPGGKQKLIERKHWLNDDYVKFIALSENMIESNGEGIISMITNHGYLDNPTFRGMRWHLAYTFDSIYILDLHGNVKKKEVSPGGSKDENIFDIQQGVSIIIAVKTGRKRIGKLSNVYHAEIYGKRADKFIHLEKNIDWNKVKLDEKDCLFIPRNIGRSDEYKQGVKVNELFIKGTSGIQTSRDSFVVDMKQALLKERINDFYDLSIDDDDIRNRNFRQGTSRYPRGDTRGWKITDVRRTDSPDLDNLIRKYSYRPFDNRYIAYSLNLIDWPRYDVMQHMLKKNLSITIGRQGQAVGSGLWDLVFMQDSLSDLNLFYRGGGVVYPLYIYRVDGTVSTNFNPETYKDFSKNLREEYKPEDHLDYIYAILHSPEYRARYKEFLRTDFPRIPIPQNDTKFKAIINLGSQLRELHLMTSDKLNNFKTTYANAGNDKIENLKYESEKVWINSTQYFGDVPSVAWNLSIGGYQPAQKWLKDRYGCILSSDEIEYYQKVITALTETERIMKEIDKVSLD